MDIFKVHMLNQKGVEKAERIKMAFEKCVMDIELQARDGDERCLAIFKTKMEEACFYAKKAMASDSKNHKKENE
jgi:hypothetical protein